jgi:hypothetical protein
VAEPPVAEHVDARRAARELLPIFSPFVCRLMRQGGPVLRASNRN